MLKYAFYCLRMVQEWGTVGVLVISLVTLGLGLFYGHRLFTNHLVHLQSGINRVNKDLTDFKEESHKDSTKLKERVAHIEGRLVK